MSPKKEEREGLIEGTRIRRIGFSPRMPSARILVAPVALLALLAASSSSIAVGAADVRNALRRNSAGKEHSNVGEDHNVELDVKDKPSSARTRGGLIIKGETHQALVGSRWPTFFFSRV